MASGVPGRDQRKLLFGTKVEEPAAVLPATATAHIFTVAGGRVIVTSLTGQCTTVCSATATTVSVGHTPLTGTAQVAALATATAVTSAEVGSLVSLPITKGALLVNLFAGGSAQAPGSGGYVVPPGQIDIVTSATNTGAFKWTLTYVPLDDGATVVAV